MKSPAAKQSSANATTVAPAIASPSPPPALGASTAGGESEHEATGEEASASWSSALSATTYEPPRRRIPCNPSAGDVHRRESGAPWRVDVDEKIRAANAKAKDEQLERRRWGLAKQIQDGLVHAYGMNYGVAELATLLKTGVALKAQQQPELASHEVAFVQLLAAAEKYDLKQVAMLLDKFPKGRNAASTKRK